MSKISNGDNYDNRIDLKPVHLLDGIEEIRQDFEERIEQGDCFYGFEILDDYVETIRRGSLTYILAQPNCGKSAVSQFIAVNLAKQGKKVLICSCEMGAGLLMERQLLNLTGIRNFQLREMYEKHRDTADSILDSVLTDDNYRYLNNIDICETGGATIEDIMEMLDCFPEYEYIIVDYIQRIRGKGTDYENISNASRELQTYARRTRKSLIVCSQAKRGSGTSTKENLTNAMGAAKGSGSIEEDGDIGLILTPLNEDDERYILATLFKNRYGLKDITYKYRFDSRLNFILEQRGFHEE